VDQRCGPCTQFKLEPVLAELYKPDTRSRNVGKGKTLVNRVLAREKIENWQECDLRLSQFEERCFQKTS
jgi:hypothetical protein